MMNVESELKKVNEIAKTGLWQKYRGPILIGLALLLALCYFAYQHLNKPQLVTGESQQQAETSAGVDLAAKNAHINMLQSQLKEAAQQIAYLKNKPPETVIHTVPIEVPKIVEVEREKRGADFAIVTDPANPSKQVDFHEIEKLPAETAVTLNQYNVYAYKKIIRGVNVFPDWGEAMQGNFKIDEVTADVSRRITKDGKYLGVAGGYEFDEKKAKLGLRYSF